MTFQPFLAVEATLTIRATSSLSTRLSEITAVRL
jgi:hypothetical protein